MKHAVLQNKLTDRNAASAGKSSSNPLQLLKDKAAQLATAGHNNPLQMAGPLEEELPAQGKFAAQLAAGPEEELPVQGKFTTQLAAPEEELPVQGKFATQLQGGLEEELPVQGKFTTQLVGGAEEEPLQMQPENKTGLSDNLKSGIENLSGYSMDSVKVHYNSSQPAQLNALAYAQGTDIHVGPGQEKHVPHEAWHVVQQMAGRVQPTMESNGVPINDSAALETEADVMGAKANNL
ncbi:protein of unknown function [Filimonas lacunae]|uniref:eCIS core domain-containing protein n=1 Tax=Filimonas lacunae TaxID=477680 RepID=A0A173MEY3_9BACT|nr:DUF4157 domain-containing protein [Filimonas lacunae]BAV05991.1 hypothetical protein FLA_2006 [Filimonas lacunae]SIT24084.1 protein of unknown function [Filimonas lacunae]